MPFEGICLTDTFQMYEKRRPDLRIYMPDNSERRTRQKELDIRVIMGNPPYSAGQDSANDNNANVAYPSSGRTYPRHLCGALHRDQQERALRQLHPGDPLGIRPDRRCRCHGLCHQCGLGRRKRRGRDAHVPGGGVQRSLRLPSSRQCPHLGGASKEGAARSSAKARRAANRHQRLRQESSCGGARPIFFHDIGDYLDQKQKLATIRNCSVR